MSQTPSKLTLLLPTTPYVLAYSLPLLLLSVLLTFAGTFLTIDRSRSFTPRNDASTYSSLPVAFDHPKKKRRFSWLLEGGIGGLASGYAFGRMSFLSHQYLQVYIDNCVFSSPSLYPPCSSHTCDIFLCCAIFQIIPCCLDLILYRHHLPCRTIQVRRCAIIECIRRVGRLPHSSLFMPDKQHNNSVLFSLSLCVILHPSLTPRVIFITVITILLMVLVLISTVIPRLSTLLLHPLLRLCTSSTGAFGLVLSIALLAKSQIDPWADIWERLWVQDGDGWGSGKEQGLSAAWGVFLSVGIIADWAFHRWLGECPDEVRFSAFVQCVF